VSEHKIKKLKNWKNQSSNPHPRQLPNKFKMSKLGTKESLFKIYKKSPNTGLEGIFPWKGFTCFSFGSLTLAFPDTF
jgi:hypothetical protein